MYIFTDRFGKRWITAEGLYRYFGVRVYSNRRYFYRYEIYARYWQ